MVTSLSRAVQDLNHHVDIILPKYDCLNLSNVSFVSVSFFTASAFLPFSFFLSWSICILSFILHF